MRDALVGALEARVPPGDVRGLYFKGSGSKPWHAPCDYIPELSDVDLQVWLTDAAAGTWIERFRETGYALDFAEDTDERFFAVCPQPLHVPRPQLLILNHAMQGRWHRSHVQVLRGAAYPGADPTPAEDRAILLDVSAQAATLGLDQMDKSGPWSWAALRQVAYRVSPLPARLLSAAGAGTRVWDEPRSTLLAELVACDFGEVAEALHAYTEQCWAAFGSGWRDGPVMRQATRHALSALHFAAGAVSRDA